MLELLVVGLVFCGLAAAVGFVGFILSAVVALIALPFKLMGVLFRGIGCLMVAPVVLAALALVGVVILGPFALLLAIPLLPILLLVGLVRLFRRPAHGAR